MKSCSILCTYIQVPAELDYFEGTLYSEASAVSLLPYAQCLVWLLSPPRSGAVEAVQRHYAVAITITMNTVHMAAATRHSPRYIACLQSKQVRPAPVCKYMIYYQHTQQRLICYLCMSSTKPSASIGCVVLQNTDKHTVKIWNGIYRYSAKRYSVRCWYRCTALKLGA